MRYPETPSAERTMEAEDPPPPPRSSPPSSSSSAMCEIVTNLEILPLIFSLHRNHPNRDSVDEPRGSMLTAASSGSSSQDTEDLQAIKLKV